MGVTIGQSARTFSFNLNVKNVGRLPIGKDGIKALFFCPIALTNFKDIPEGWRGTAFQGMAYSVQLRVNQQTLFPGDSISVASFDISKRNFFKYYDDAYELKYQGLLRYAVFTSKGLYAPYSWLSFRSLRDMKCDVDGALVYAYPIVDFEL